MTTLLELKEKLVRFYSKNEVYVTPVIRFLVAFVTFMLINTNIGYMTSVSRLPIALILALVCAVLPINGTIVIAAALVLLDFYSLSLEVCLVALILFAIIYLVYFRFVPKNGYNAVLTPVCFKLGIPYIVPVASGLLNGVVSVFSIICGTVLYFFIHGVKENAAVLSDTAESSENATSKVVVTLNQLLGNKEMYLVIAIFTMATLIVYLVRRMDIDNAWTIAWVSGVLFESIGLIAGYMLLGIEGKMIGVLVGSIISCVIAFVIQFLCFNVDYSRTERLQFEDDEYYYYVKAIPKSIVSGSDKKIKRFSGTEDKERMDKKRFAEEMDIDEEWLD